MEAVTIVFHFETHRECVNYSTTLTHTQRAGPFRCDNKLKQNNKIRKVYMVNVLKCTCRMMEKTHVCAQPWALTYMCV